MTERDAAAEPRWLMPRGLIVVLGVTGLPVSVLAMQQFASILGPVLLALILAASADRDPSATRCADVAGGDRHSGHVDRSPGSGDVRRREPGTVPGKRCWAVPTIGLHREDT
jgi:hypothetical protein